MTLSTTFPAWDWLLPHTACITFTLGGAVVVSLATVVGLPNCSFSGTSAALTLPMQVSGSQTRYRHTMGTKAMTRMTEDHHRQRVEAT